MDIGDLLKNPDKLEEMLKEAINKEDKELTEMLIPIVRDPELTYEYAKKIAKGKIKDEWEDIIAKDSFSSYNYASKVLHGPFPKGEDAIAQDSIRAYNYAYFVIKRPFPKGEDAIASDPYFAYSYASSILKRPFPKGEDAISKESDRAFLYAVNVLDDRFKKGEKAIIKDRYYLNEYVKFLEKIGKLDEFLKDHPEIRIEI